MKKNSLTTAVVAGIAGVAGFAGLANAVHLNSDGLGQVLLYPYYTVNAGQQTLLSVVNTADVAKVVKVRFLEGYNTREVLDFNLWLSPFDVWTATVFNLRDAGKNSDGGAIFTRDNSCTTPRFSAEGTSLDDGTPYVAFKNFAYLGAFADGGPTDVLRTREGHFEMITMADVTGTLAAAVTHGANGVPANCSATIGILGSDSRLVAPTSGLFGAAGVINVGEGTFYTYTADALDQFTVVKLFTSASNLTPNLGSVNDSSFGSEATAHVFTNAGVTTSTYGPEGVAGGTRPIDAVSAVFSADAIYNEYSTSASIGAQSDWVVTFPTKAFYVDPGRLPVGSPALQPFEELFYRPAGAPATQARSCAAIDIDIYDREEKTPVFIPDEEPFSPPPPGEEVVRRALCKEVNVISFLDVDEFPSASAVLGSTLISNIRPVVGPNGWLKLELNPNNDHDLLPAENNGNVWRGLPVQGFWANKVVNNNVVDGVLANYSGVFRHRTSRDCAITQGGEGGDLACS